ncbi:MAG: YARHG domain-containing protein [Bacillota bacterium]|nr:YARHG domain-containing protein [Bacillota bacterium]
MIFCTNCGQKLDESQRFCLKCGKPIVHNLYNSQIQNQKPNMVSPQHAGANQPEPAMQIYSQSQSQHFFNSADQNQQSFKDRTGKKAGKSKKPVIISLIVIACLLAAGIGIFFKQIKGTYFFIRYKSVNDLGKKFDYAEQALENLKSNSASNAFKESAEMLAKEDSSRVLNKLDDMNGLVKEEDLKALKTDIYNEKASEAVKAKKYNEALYALVKINENGGNIRDNNNYEDIMLNIAAEVTGSKASGSKEDLEKAANVIFGNLDSDPYDEIVQIKDLTGNAYLQKQYEINLYKLKNNKYEKVSSLSDKDDEYISGQICNYDKNKMGLYLLRTVSGYISSGEVYRVKNNSFESLGTVDSSDPCEIADFDKDGKFEIKTSSMDDASFAQYSHADAPRIIKYYKFKDDGSEPVMSKAETSNSSSSSDSNSTVIQQPTGDFIFSDSDKRYLTDSEVTALPKEQLGYARNEIYARHGFVFKTDKYNQYFSVKSWYTPNPGYDGSDSILNEYEKANYKLIEKYEKQ